MKAFDSFQGKIAKWEWEVKKQEAESHYGRREILQLIPNCLTLQILFHFFRSWLTVKLGNIWRQLSRKVSHSGDMKNTLIASHLTEKQSTGRREEIPRSRCILQKIPQCKHRLPFPLKHDSLFKTKTQHRSLPPTVDFRFSSKLFISPQQNVHPYRKQVLLSGS